MSDPSEVNPRQPIVRPWRSRKRDESHDSAHADEESAAEVPEFPRVPRGAAQLVTTPDALAELLARLRVAGSFAYDTEFIGELTYVPKLCLIQVATPGFIALVDPLASLDLAGLWDLIADASIEKIVHAGEQDLEIVVRQGHREPINVFDTQIGAGMAGMAFPVSLSKLVQELTGARLVKGHTFTQWDRRPLSGSQLRYAADDVRYLPTCRAILGERLAEFDHLKWSDAEFAAQCEPTQYHFDPAKDFWRVRGAGGLASAELAILRELTIWRDAAARSHDVPPRSLVRDETLLDLARSPAKQIDRLSNVRGLPRPVESAHGAEIVEATLRALATPASDHPATARNTEQTPSERFAADSLWAVTQCLCIGQALDPNLVTSRQEVADLHKHLTTQDTEPDTRILKGWRREAIGESLVNLVRSGGAVSFKWEANALRTHRID